VDMEDQQHLSKKQKLSEEDEIEKGVAFLRSLPAIRERCAVIYEAAKADSSKHFVVDLRKLDTVVDYVKETMDINYPGNAADIPFHSRFRHFEAGNLDRVEQLKEEWGESCDAAEKTRRLLDLVVVSVLLDAGAGDSWKYTEESNNNAIFNRSEGLGVASFHMFCSGAFSSDSATPHRVDSEALKALATSTVATAFQVNEETNPLVGCDGRSELLQRLGTAIESRPDFFCKDGIFRPGNMYDYLQSKVTDGKVSTHDLWEVVMYGFEKLWPEGRLNIGGNNMGDVWPHSALSKSTEANGSDEEKKEDNPLNQLAGLVPFHKLSQWMTYSLMEPLQTSGLNITDMHFMTGLPEYRNGGLLVDLGILVPKYDTILTESHLPDSEVIVEWRALTVCLLDEVATSLRTKLGVSAEEFPLVKILEGGTWKAGRRIAKQLRPSTCGPPIVITSDGTVF